MKTDIIPQEKNEALVRALEQTFGVTAFDEIREMNKGAHQALVYRIVVKGTPYLLRVIMRSESPARHYNCMLATAAAGLSPRVLYANIEDKVSITDFIEPFPFAATDALIRMPAALRAVHALPAFAPRPIFTNTTPTFLIHEGPALDGFMQKFRAAQVIPETEIDQLFALRSQLSALYPRNDEDQVSSHCDLKPENLVFDGHRAWLIDWEAAFTNDRYCDLAVMANFIVANETHEIMYLREYFAQEPGEYELARYFLMQQIVHLFYALGYLWLGSSGKPVDLDAPVPEFTAFHRSLWACEIDLDSKANKVVYGKVHRQRLLQNIDSPRWPEALKIVSAKHANG